MLVKRSSRTRNLAALEMQMLTNDGSVFQSLEQFRILPHQHKKEAKMSVQNLSTVPMSSSWEVVSVLLMIDNVAAMCRDHNGCVTIG